MSPNDPEYKSFFAKIAKSYTEDVELENLHRDNLIRHTVACIFWIIASILEVWDIVDFGNDPVWVTIVGVMIIVLLCLQLYSVHIKHKRRVRELLQHRQTALQWKDGKVP
jgi:hypothetical protein